MIIIGKDEVIKYSGYLIKESAVADVPDSVI